VRQCVFDGPVSDHFSLAEARFGESRVWALRRTAGQPSDGLECSARNAFCARLQSNQVPSVINGPQDDADWAVWVAGPVKGPNVAREQLDGAGERIGVGPPRLAAEFGIYIPDIVPISDREKVRCDLWNAHEPPARSNCQHPD